MGATEVRDHWEQRWDQHAHQDMGWFQSEPEPSLELVTSHTPAGGSVLDVGGGASRLVDRLLGRGYQPTVLDIAEPALAAARARLGERAEQVTWVHGDVTDVHLGRTFDTWHDRAVLHFLLKQDDRAAYVTTLREHLVVGGHAVIGTFSPDGPDSCSGLPVRRHSAADLQQLAGPGFRVLEDRAVVHTKPSGDEQAFTFVVLQRRDGGPPGAAAGR